MKPIINCLLPVFALISAFVLGGCERTWYNDYTIANSTDHEIEIKAYNVNGVSADKINYLERIVILAHSDYSVSKARGYGSEEQGVFKTIETDSVVIIFDNVRIIKQCCDEVLGSNCDFDRNVMNYAESYDIVKSGRSCGKDEFRYTFTITEEDHNNAIIIDGK